MDGETPGQGDKVAGKIRTHRDLMVWQNGMDDAMPIFERILSQLVVMTNQPERWTINTLKEGKR